MRETFQYYLTIGLLVAVAWAAPHEGHDHGGHSDDHFHHLHHGKEQPHPSHNGGHDSCHVLSSPNADFTIALYKNLNALPASQGKNVFFSPLGVTMALSMLAIGAKGDTLKQIFSSLGYGDLKPEQVHEGYEHLLHMLGHNQDAMQLESGSAMALREGFKVRDKFLKDVQHHYQGSAFIANFEKPEVAAAEINKFIAGKTHDKITDLVKNIDPSTVMILINYMFFRGKWDKPFPVEKTQKAEFHVDENTKVMVDMMKRTGRYEVYQDLENHTSIMMLPYKGNTSMMVILPDEGKMKEVEGKLSKEQLQHWHDSLFRGSLDVFMPKFSISATYSLEDTLKDMGMVNAFSDNADFSEITDEAKVKVSKISQKAVISVDEKGTDAAVATTIEIMPMSLPDTIMLNRPFLLLIVEHSTKSILFMGKITDPTAK